MNAEQKDRETVRKIFQALTCYEDIMTPNQAEYVSKARKQFMENGEFAALMEWGQVDNLNCILKNLRLQKINQCI